MPWVNIRAPERSDMDTKRPVSKYSENEQELWNQVLADTINIKTLFSRMDEMQRKIQKLEEAYYQQFPDRLDKDLEFEKQFQALNFPTQPGALPEKP